MVLSILETVAANENWIEQKELTVSKCNNNNNNKAFKSQTSWGMLELKPIRSNQGSGT